MDFFDVHNPQIKRRVIIENDLAFAFPAQMSIVPGHTLICPKRPVQKFEEMTSDEKNAVFNLAEDIKRALKKSFLAEGFNIAWNESKVAGQSVAHYHLHVLPRKIGDTGIVEYEPRQFLYRPGPRPSSPENELIDIAQRIKKHL